MKNVDKHTSAQLSFSTKYQGWNNVDLSTLNRRNSLDIVSTLFCQRWNNINKCKSGQLSFSIKYKRWCLCWVSFLIDCHKPGRHTEILSVTVLSEHFHSFLKWLSQYNIYLNFSAFLCNKRPVLHHVYWICYETATYNVMIIFNISVVNRVHFSKTFPKLKDKLTSFISSYRQSWTKYLA